MTGQEAVIAEECEQRTGKLGAQRSLPHAGSYSELSLSFEHGKKVNQFQTVASALLQESVQFTFSISRL